MGEKRTIAAVAATAAFLFMAGCDQQSTAAEPAGAEVPVGKGFDFYVLALSWSPSYCASEGKHANSQQCGADADYGFVVHGLWPQYERGYPADCPTDQPLSVPRSLSDSMLDIMPSTGLVRHQWRKHGTCTGLSQADYFFATRAAFERIDFPETDETIRTVDPDRFEADFRAANPGLPADAVAVTCDRRYLREVRVCMSLDLGGYVSCPEVDDDGCRRDGAVMPPAN